MHTRLTLTVGFKKEFTPCICHQWCLSPSTKFYVMKFVWIWKLVVWSFHESPWTESLSCWEISFQTSPKTWKSLNFGRRYIILREMISFWSLVLESRATYLDFLKSLVRYKIMPLAVLYMDAWWFESDTYLIATLAHISLGNSHGL